MLFARAPSRAAGVQGCPCPHPRLRGAPRPVPPRLLPTPPGRPSPLVSQRLGLGSARPFPEGAIPSPTPQGRGPGRLLPAAAGPRTRGTPTPHSPRGRGADGGGPDTSCGSTCGIRCTTANPACRRAFHNTVRTALAASAGGLGRHGSQLCTRGFQTVSCIPPALPASGPTRQSGSGAIPPAFASARGAGQCRVCSLEGVSPVSWRAPQPRRGCCYTARTPPPLRPSSGGAAMSSRSSLVSLVVSLLGPLLGWPL